LGSEFAYPRLQGRAPPKAPTACQRFGKQGRQAWVRALLQDALPRPRPGRRSRPGAHIIFCSSLFFVHHCAIGSPGAREREGSGPDHPPHFTGRGRKGTIRHRIPFGRSGASLAIVWSFLAFHPADEVAQGRLPRATPGLRIHRVTGAPNRMGTPSTVSHARRSRLVSSTLSDGPMSCRNISGWDLVSILSCCSCIERMDYFPRGPGDLCRRQLRLKRWRGR
jgi:hypothetical protein